MEQSGIPLRSKINDITNNRIITIALVAIRLMINMTLKF